MVAEGNDALLEEFFEKGTLAAERLVEGLRSAVREMRLFPVLCASGLNNIGTDLILDFIVDYFPAPVERGAAHRPCWTGKKCSGRFPTPSRSPPLSSRPWPTRSPAGCPTSKSARAC